MTGMRGNCARVLEHLKKCKGITSMEAFERFGVTRLSAIIFNLRNAGYYIVSYPTKGKNRFGEPVQFSEYRLVE